MSTQDKNDPVSSDPGSEARAAVERAAAESIAVGGKEKRQHGIGPVRYNLEAFGVAILGAVLLKWFCLEAFAIPTSSMQPTLMGSSEAGIYDRLLVDKLTPALREPQRWDVTVFSYPLQKNQNYVKRIIGMPGEHLQIAGGNLYTVESRNGERVHTVLRKPDRIQQGLWKNVYPARQLVREEPEALREFFHAVPSRSWSEGTEPGSFAVELEEVPGRVYKLEYSDRGEGSDGGFVNRVFDGYPTGTAQAIRAKSSSPLVEIVPDARIAATFTPEQAIAELTLAVEVRRPGHDVVTFALHIEGGTGKLQVRSADGVVAESAGFVCELPAGEATEIGFAHLDDELIAYRDGSERLRFDTQAYPIREGCELDGPGATPNHAALPLIRLRGKGRVAIDELRIDRDLHYTRICAPGMGTAKLLPDEPIEIPDGHYFMMGDNTLQSIDSRGWTALTVGLSPDGQVILPDRVADVDGARLLRGNARIVDPTSPPDRDETPVVISSRNKMAMIDEFGEVHALDAQANVTSGEGGRMQLSIASGQDGRSDWTPPEEWVPFVPREHIRGRALLIFWRWPFPRLMPIR